VVQEGFGSGAALIINKLLKTIDSSLSKRRKRGIYTRITHTERPALSAASTLEAREKAILG
jgi:hypothetical protein